MEKELYVLILGNGVLLIRMIFFFSVYYESWKVNLLMFDFEIVLKRNDI